MKFSKYENAIIQFGILFTPPNLTIIEYEIIKLNIFPYTNINSFSAKIRDCVSG